MYAIVNLRVKPSQVIVWKEGTMYIISPVSLIIYILNLIELFGIQRVVVILNGLGRCYRRQWIALTARGAAASRPIWPSGEALLNWLSGRSLRWGEEGELEIERERESLIWSYNKTESKTVGAKSFRSSWRMLAKAVWKACSQGALFI